MLQSYSDGKVDRWIELPGPDGKEPESPAPVKLGAGVQAADTHEEGEEHHEVAGETLARTGSGSRMLTVLAGLLLMAGGSSIFADAGLRRRQQLR